MSEKRKTTLVSDLVLDHGTEIKKLRNKGATVTRLVTQYGCARNTMTKALIELGFDGPEWTKPKDEK